MRKNTRGFSLVELLVVIAIIAILAAVLFPAVTSALRKGKMTHALNNLKQVVQRSVTYATDNKDFLPTPRGAAGRPAWSDLESATFSKAWFNGLLRYSDAQTAADFANNSEAFYKPGNLLYLPGARYPGNRDSRPFWAYTMNKNLSKDQNGAEPVKIHAISKPTITVYMLESGMVGEKMYQSGAYEDKSMAGPGSFVGRYDGRGVLAFLDGHGESRKIAEIITKGGSPQPTTKDVIWTVDPADTPAL